MLERVPRRPTMAEEAVKEATEEEQKFMYSDKTIEATDESEEATDEETTTDDTSEESLADSTEEEKAEATEGAEHEPEKGSAEAEDQSEEADSKGEQSETTEETELDKERRKNEDAQKHIQRQANELGEVRTEIEKLRLEQKERELHARKPVEDEYGDGDPQKLVDDRVKYSKEQEELEEEKAKLASKERVEYNQRVVKAYFPDAEEGITKEVGALFKELNLLTTDEQVDAFLRNPYGQAEPELLITSGKLVEARKKLVKRDAVIADLKKKLKGVGDNIQKAAEGATKLKGKRSQSSDATASGGQETYLYTNTPIEE
jgi:hypothetical protein